MRVIPIIIASTLFSGCVILSADSDRELTIAAVQRDIHIGMSGAEVAATLGSPNIVTTDEFRNEVWIYDRFSTDSVHTDGPDTLSFLQAIVDIESIGEMPRRRTESSNQRTLTVIIKFDEHGRVSDYAYHTSRF